MKLILALALALALALGACGGGDSESDSPAESSPPAQSEQPGAQDSSGAEPPADVADGDGGTSAADSQRAAGSKRKSDRNAATPQKSDSGTSVKRPAKKPRTPSEHLAALPPSERRKLEHDLYEQGKNFCSAQGPKEIAKSYRLPSSDPETVARLYARAYESATPELALPFQQGCLAGFERFERSQRQR